MPGSGVKSDHINNFKAIGINEIHGSFSKNNKTQIAILENAIAITKK